ncbi:MAG: fimbrial protein [Lysobacter sp.]|nr:MAG: fimbrial protein [Lysobacter sp.]
MSLKELDFNNAGAWPKEWQIGFCVLLGLLILIVLWNFMTASKGDVLEALETEEKSKRGEFEIEAQKAANLEPLKQQLLQMEQQLQQMLRQLPSKTEMPDLIVDISQTALATGIQNDKFEPGEETMKEFYAEKPISLKMVGTYHQFGAFVSGVASLPRVVIMTMHDISLKPKDDKANPTKDKVLTIGPNSVLELEGTVKTYRYRDETETVQAAGGANATPGAGPASPAVAPPSASNPPTPAAVAAPTTPGGSR